jgi:hypothetical protein
LHALAATDHALVELSGRIERSVVDGHFIFLVAPAAGSPSWALEIGIAHVEACDVLFEDSAGRKTCRILLSSAAPIRRLCTAADLASELSTERQEDPDSRDDAANDPVATWSGTWPSSPAAGRPEPEAAGFGQVVPPASPAAGPTANAAAAMPGARIESYQGQLYYYFPTSPATCDCPQCTQIQRGFP